MWLRYAEQLTVESQSSSPGLGLPGGFHPYFFHLSDRFGGPRWWKLEYDGNLDQFIRNQYRYNPQYIGIGEATEGDESWKEVYTLSSDELLGVDPENIELYIIPERQESSMIAIYNTDTNQFRVIDMEDNEVTDSIAKEPKAWQVIKEVDDNNNILLFAKRMAPGDKKGIFDVNGKPAAPGFAYIFKETPSPTPANSPHGNLNEFLWDNWRSTVNYK